MPETLIVYATTDGHTRTIGERIQAIMRRHGHEAALVDVAQAETLDAGRFDCVIAGASVRYGKHDPRMARFLDAHSDWLSRIPSAFFSVNLTARKPEKRSPGDNAYVRKLLDGLSFQPDHIEVFAGRLDYPSYGFLDRLMIQLIMKMTGGPTDRNAVIDYTDWEQVDRFADRMLRAQSGEAAPEKAGE